MSVWIDQKEETYNGCLMILNIGDENISSISNDFVEHLREKVSEAHANGRITIWAFDSSTGPFKIPDDFDNIEGMDFIRMMFDVCKRRDSNFKADFSERMAEFKAIAAHMGNHDSFRYNSRNFAIGGQISIAGQKVLMPITDIG